MKSLPLFLKHTSCWENYTYPAGSGYEGQRHEYWIMSYVHKRRCQQHLDGCYLSGVELHGEESSVAIYREKLDAPLGTRVAVQKDANYTVYFL